MGKIQIMDDHLANQIAAGEVVERPASIVKELVENAIDADATKITIQIQEGGIQYIRVSDNGGGMTPEDAQLAFARHATSKIRTEKDLFAIRTLGFRGEALPSIASVAKVRMKTAYDKDQLGVSLLIRGGEIQSIEETSRTRGTDIEVEDLFYNTPARLKYLKTVNTEVSHVADVVGRLALAHPHISFVLRHDKRELFRTSGDGKKLHVIHALYGKQVASRMFAIEEKDFDLTIQGYFTQPEITRANRSYLTILLNGRYVRSIPITQSILRAYATYLPVSRFPIGVLSIEMEPQLMDVNVHPAKLEVRLSKEKELCQRVESGIRKGLQSQTLTPAADQPRSNSSRSQTLQQQLQWSQPRHVIRESSTEKSQKPAQTGESKKPKPSIQSEYRSESNSFSYESVPRSETIQNTEKSVEVNVVEDTGKLPRLEPLTQVHGTYIVAQSEDGFYLMDQHAAHERIYYEQFSRKMKENRGYGQPFLIPLTVECTPAEAEILRNSLEDLRAWGLEIEPFGGTTFLIRSQPNWFQQEEEKELIHELITWLKQKGKIESSELRDESAKMMACKAAIKANRYLKREEMEQLLYQLNQCENPFTCPHGRPILIHFSTYELEKMFKRVM